MGVLAEVVGRQIQVHKDWAEVVGCQVQVHKYLAELHDARESLAVAHEASVDMDIDYLKSPGMDYGDHRQSHSYIAEVAVSAFDDQGVHVYNDYD